MPEYIPPVAPPTGLAEQLIRMRESQPSPLAALVQGLSGAGNQVMNAIIQKKMASQNQLTPEQVMALNAMAQGQTSFTSPTEMMRTGTVVGGKKVFDESAPAVLPTSAAFPKGQIPPAGTSYLEKQISLQEASKREKAREDEMMKRAQLKASEELTKGHRQLTDEALKSMSPEVLKKVKDMGYQAGDWIPERFFSEQAKPAATAKNTAAMEAQWTQLFRLTNPTDAMRGSPLGLAAVANQRANRAMEILDDTKMTPQRKSLAIVDLAGIMQGGTPHEQEIAAQSYGTLQDRWANIKQQLTADPQKINQPEIVAEIRDLIRGVKEVDNQIIKDNLDQAETFFSDRIKQHGPEKWDKYKKSVLSSLDYKPSHTKSGGLKKSPKDRFDELIKSGKSEDEAYKILAQEGH